MSLNKGIEKQHIFQEVLSVNEEKRITKLVRKSQQLTCTENEDVVLPENNLDSWRHVYNPIRL